MVNLAKGKAVSLAKASLDEGGSGSLTKVRIGLGWDELHPQQSGHKFDLDASVFVVDDNDIVLSPGHFVFYNNLVSPEGAITHTGDNRTGSGDGDDESIIIDLTLLPANTKSLVFAVTIDEAEARGQSFGMVKNAYVKAYDDVTGLELVNYKLEDSFSDFAVVFAKLIRLGGDWNLAAVPEGYPAGLEGLVVKYGLTVD
ncbi:MAG: TerD family protein [Candidatus Microsaccharimonas sp.]